MLNIKRKMFLFTLSVILVLILASCSGETILDGEANGSDDNLSVETLTESLETDNLEVETAETTQSQDDTADEPSRINPNDPDFYIVYTEGEVDFSTAPKAYIDIYRWGKDYTPEAFAQAVFKKDEGFHIRMECAETDPLAVYTEHNDPVYYDSCLEFFAIYMPKISEKYVNIEMNANGAYLCYFCDSINKTLKMNTLTEDMPVVTAFKTDESWGVDLFVPLEMIYDAYGSSDIGEGSTILANFYKCGDKTEIPHYGSWNEVINNKPNFHLPQYFAEVEIKKPD